MLLAKLEDDGCITTVGQATGGSAEGPTAGRIFMLELPNSGITTRLPNMFNVMNIRSFRQGFGVMPDVEVKDTVAAFRAGKDLVLEAALAQVTK